jgi:hypothetical protein
MLVPSYLKEARLLTGVSVPIRSYQRSESLAATLAEVAPQTVADLHVVVSSQSRHRAEDSTVARSTGRVISPRGGSVERYAPRPSVPRKTNPIPASYRGVD